MIIRIDLNSKEAIYVQLMNQIKIGIAKGYLKESETLPSIRSLSSELGINMHTVSKSYKLLEKEGLISINKSKNVEVSQIQNKDIDEYETTLKHKIKQLVAESSCYKISEETFISYTKNIFNELRGNK